MINCTETELYPAHKQLLAAEHKHNHYVFRPDCFLLVDLRELFFRFRVGGTKKINKKALKMTS